MYTQRFKVLIPSLFVFGMLLSGSVFAASALVSNQISYDNKNLDLETQYVACEYGKPTCDTNKIFNLTIPYNSFKTVALQDDNHYIVFVAAQTSDGSIKQTFDVTNQVCGVGPNHQVNFQNPGQTPRIGCVAIGAKLK